jgi:hypothetical protein
MKKILPILVCILCGCGKAPSTPPVSPISQEGCPEQPQGTLEPKSVKSITLSTNSLSETGQINAGKHKGFSFEAKKGQKFSYRTKEEVCVWIYTPSNTLTQSDELPVDGKYTVQVSALKGSTSFNLEMELKDPGMAQQSVPSSTTSSSTSSSTTETTTPTQSTQVKSSDTSSTSSATKPNPEQFIRDYYSNLNSRNYDAAWKGLSSDFQGISGSFSDYSEWWDSVDEIELGSARLVSQDGNQAIVDANLTYVMKTGARSEDGRGRIYLAWNSDKSNWEMTKKKAP